MKFDFTVLTRAGITQAQFAELIGVSRITVNTWVRKRFTPHPTLRPRVTEALKKLREAVREGSLPVPEDSHARAVAQRLRAVRSQLPAA